MNEQRLFGDHLRRAGIQPHSFTRSTERGLILPPGQSTLQDLDSILSEWGPLPREALVLGAAFDGLPLLLNLHDPVPGPLLMAADSGVGKTHFLQTVARGAVMTHSPEDLQFGVVTGTPEEWPDVSKIPHSVGVFDAAKQGAADLILSLASWAHGNKTTRQSVLLLFDGLENIERMDFDARQNLRWLLLRGPSRRVWPIVTVRPDSLQDTYILLEPFRTRMFGPIADARARVALGVDESADLDALPSHDRFTMREGNSWLRFWVPS